MLSYAGLTRQQAGLLCYTSVVINWNCTGSGPIVLFARLTGDCRQLVHAAAIAAGILRVTHSAFRRGKGF
jgi:hypothetical protein